MTRKIGFLGPHGTFTEEATHVLFHDPKVFELIPYQTIADCLIATSENEVEACVVPIENSIEGSVNMTLDILIHEVDLPISAEIIVPISHCLYSIGTIPLDQIEKLYSHPQAIAQCRQFLRKHMPKVKIVEMDSTAKACQYVHDQSDHKRAAIGPSIVKSIYDLHVLAQDIQDYENNFTRFVLCGIESFDLPESEKHKTSLLVTLPQDFQGALYQVLAAFAWRKINLSRIESRPTKKQLGSYHFFIDVEQGMDEILLPGAIAEIEALGCQVRLLGSFPSFVKNLKKINC